MKTFKMKLLKLTLSITTGWLVNTYKIKLSFRSEIGISPDFTSSNSEFIEHTKLQSTCKKKKVTAYL